MKESGGEHTIVVYLDVYWGVNFGMNLLVLWIFSKLIHVRIRLVRLCLAAVIGATGAVVLLLLPIRGGIASLLLFHVPVSVGMLQIALPYRGFRHFIGDIAGFYLTAFLTGGILTFLYSNMNVGYVIWELKQKQVYDGMSLWMLIKCITFLLLIVSPFLRYMRAYRRKAGCFCQVEIHYGQKKVKGTGFLDTGNHLREPYSKDPVLIGEWEWLSALFTEGQLHFIRQNAGMEKLEEMDDQENYVPLMFIPFHSVGKMNGILPGIRMDRVITGENRKAIQHENVIVAFYQGSLSADREYQILLHNELT